MDTPELDAENKRQDDEAAAAQFAAESEAKVKAFLREQGIIPAEERMKEIAASLPPEEQERWGAYEEALRPLQESLKKLPEVERLHSLRQLGRKMAPAKEEELGPYAKRGVLHTRFHHSEFLAECVLLAASRISMPVEKAKACVMAAWLHDIGHSAFSHTGDELLLSKGYPDHEERSKKHLRESPEIQAILQAEGINANEVSELISEEGPYGTLQSMADTLSYLVFDTHAAGAPAYPDHGREVLADIRGIDEGRNRLIVLREEPWQDMLEVRALMMKHVYYHPRNKLLDQALQQLLRKAVDGGHISLDEIENGSDDLLMYKLQSLVQRNEGVALLSGRVRPDGTADAEPYLSAYADLFDFAMGFVPEGWSKAVFDTEAEADSFLATKPAAAIERSLVVKPFDYTKKKFDLLIEPEGSTVGEEVTLRAKKVELRPEDSKFVVYFPEKA